MAIFTTLKAVPWLWSATGSLVCSCVVLSWTLCVHFSHIGLCFILSPPPLTSLSEPAASSFSLSLSWSGSWKVQSLVLLSAQLGLYLVPISVLLPTSFPQLVPLSLA